MSIDIINESLFHLLTEISNNAENMLNNINSDMIISLENSVSINMLKEKDKVIKKQKIALNKLTYILDVMQQKLLDKEIKITDLKDMLDDKIKLTEILTKQIIEHNSITDDNTKNEFLCDACMENTKKYLYQPCMHLCYCEKCYDKADKHVCPICRTKNSKLSKIFFN
jgi:hypothetical protein